MVDINVPSPLGLEAGVEKNAEMFYEFYKIAFGFVETGTVTPRPQDGNPKPRIFRLQEDMALINKLGFNNVGLDSFVSNIISNKPNESSQKIGANLGPNKESENRIEDYIEGLKRVSSIVDYITINISSPNTPDVRDVENSHITERHGELRRNR